VQLAQLRWQLQKALAATQQQRVANLWFKLCALYALHWQLAVTAALLWVCSIGHVARGAAPLGAGRVLLLGGVGIGGVHAGFEKMWAAMHEGLAAAAGQ
jgi:hypothetical protein